MTVRWRTLSFGLSRSLCSSNDHLQTRQTPTRFQSLVFPISCTPSPTTVIADHQNPRSLAVGRPRGFERSQAISDNRGDPSLRRQPVVFEVAGEPESSRCIPPEATWMVTMESEELGEAAD
jgi:hypothetical protein